MSSQATGVSQPLIFTLSLAAFSAASAAGLRAPDAGAGFSLGECTALTASGAMSPETGFKVIRSERAKAMQRAAERKGRHDVRYTRRVSVRMSSEACAKADGYAAPVNFQLPRPDRYRGAKRRPLTSSAQTLAASGAKTVRLAVNAGFSFA
jgi:[acyl-carrier-protein] S-malonyltransferase